MLSTHTTRSFGEMLRFAPRLTREAPMVDMDIEAVRTQSNKSDDFIDTDDQNARQLTTLSAGALCANVDEPVQTKD